MFHNKTREKSWLDHHGNPASITAPSRDVLDHTPFSVIVQGK